MSEFSVVRVRTLMKIFGERKANAMLANFSCPRNSDIEEFLRKKAVFFAEQSIANTYVVLAESDNLEPALVGYFSLSNKVLIIDASPALSSKWRRAFEKFGVYESQLAKYLIPMPLIGQLSKSFTDGSEQLISGDELLGLALERVEAAQEIISGKMAYLECNDTPELTGFYERNGFRIISYREVVESDGLVRTLAQMIRYN